MIENDLEYTGEYTSQPYERYKDNREIFQEAGNTLTEGLYAALEGRLTILGIPKETIGAVYYADNYGDDDVILNRLIGMGLERNVATSILNECKAEAEKVLRKEILAKDLPDEVVPSVLNYVTVIQRISGTTASNDDGANHDLWARQQMYQLGAAGENCPKRYLAPVLDAACFLMLNHPDPTANLFHVYKRFSQDTGAIDIRVVVEELARKGAAPNQIRAILNLHKHYGAQLGPAFLALLKNAPDLMEYNGGILQLVADFADLGLSPAMQEGIISQAGKHIDYQGGALQLAVDLAARRISASLQTAIVANCYDLQSYPGGIVKLAEDIHGGEFAEPAQANLVRHLVNTGAAKRIDACRYIKRLAILYWINPECIDAQFTGPYNSGDRYYGLVVESDRELAALTVDTSAPKLPHLTSQQRIQLFSKLLQLVRYPQYSLYRESAFLLAEKAQEWKGEELDIAINQLAQLGSTFDNSRVEFQPKGALPPATLLAEDLAIIAQSDQYNMKGRWYHDALYKGATREDVMIMVAVPVSGKWNDRAVTFKPCFEAIAERFLSDDADDRRKLAPIVGILLRETPHYYLGICFGEEDQPMKVICKYVFGLGPEEEAGVTIADIKLCEEVIGRSEKVSNKFDECLEMIDRVSISFPRFGERLRLALREPLVGAYREAIGCSVATETPIEWAYDYWQRDPSQRLSDEAAVLATPVRGFKLQLSLIENFAKIAARLGQKYPTQANNFEQFVINLLMRQPSPERMLGWGDEYINVLPGEGNCSIVIAKVGKPDLAGALSLARQLEAPHVMAKPNAIPDLAPSKLPRSAALAIGRRVGNNAGRMLKIIGESIPALGGNMINPDDDVGAVWRYVLKERVARPGFPVMGAKLHVDKAVSTELVNQLIKELGLGTSPFSTIHAGMTVLLTPGQPIEIKLLLKYLKSKGLFTDRDFDMQVCIGGRLQAKRHEASIGLLNATMLLATRATPSYAVDAWSTKLHNNETNAYIMAYGAGQRKRGMPYDLSTPGDRTDMLGRRDLNDLDLYQIVATLIMHYEHGGYFADIGEQFVLKIVAILQRYELYDTLFDAPWVFVPGITPETPNTTTLKHWEMVEAFTSMRIVAESQSGKGITGEVRSEIRRAYAQAKARFPNIVESDPGQFEKLCAL